MTETLLSTSLNHKTLSIRLSVDGFCFLSASTGGEPKQVEYSVNSQLPLAANFKQAQLQYDWLNEEYQAVDVVVCTNRFTLVPLELFDDEQCEVFFHQAQSKRDNEYIKYNVLPHSSLVAVYGIDKALLDLLLNSYPQLHIFSQISVLVEHFFNKYRFTSGRRLFVNLSGSYMLLLAMDRRQVLLANYLECKLPSDQLYYILNVWKQVGMDQELDELIIGGTIDSNDDVLKELRRFVRRVSLLEPSSNYDLHVALNE